MSLRKIFIIIGKILGIIFFLFFAVFAIAYWYTTTEWKKYYSKEEIRTMSQQINSAPSLSSNFYNLYELLYNSDRHKSNFRVYVEMAWDNFIYNNSASHESAFVKAANCYPMKYGMYPYPAFKLSWPIEKFTTPEKCFDFALFKQNEYLKENFPEALISDIDILNDTNEILKYFVIMKRPTLYIEHSKNLDNEVQQLKAKLDDKKLSSNVSTSIH